MASHSLRSKHPEGKFLEEWISIKSIGGKKLIIMANYTSENKKQNKCDTSCVEMSSKSINVNSLNLYNRQKISQNWNKDVRLGAHLKN